MPFKSESRFKKDGEPLSTYLSEHDAINGAIHVITNYANKLLPYHCPRCGHYHLTPKDRHTPSRKCLYCQDSNGMYKELYETQEAAERRAEIIADEQGIKLKVYKCPHQCGWHLTKNLIRF